MVASTIDACTQTHMHMHTLYTHIMTHIQTHTKGCKSWDTRGGWGEIFNWKKGFELLILNTYNLIQFWLIFHWVNMPDHLHWFLLGFTYHAWILWEFWKIRNGLPNYMVYNWTPGVNLITFLSKLHQICYCFLILWAVYVCLSIYFSGINFVLNFSFSP